MYSLLEKMIIAVGVIVVLVSCALYFSPVYKYGIVFSISAIIAIIASAARVRWITVLALVAVGISAWYLLDPWHGNDYLTLSYWRLANGNPDPRTAGLFHSLGNLFPARDQIRDVAVNQCVIYYGYFILDPLLQDENRFNNPEVTTFGYCTRGWITALLVLAGVLWASLVFLFALLVLALILRFRKDRSAPIELEVRPEPFLDAPLYGYGAPTAFVDPYAGGFVDPYAAGFVPAY
jgi:cell division protein FtsW (lipid II flippase)